MPPNLSLPAAGPQAKQGLGASQTSTKHDGSQTTPKKTRRRPAGKEYLMAARHRRQNQNYQNWHHPPALEDIWICEFCEYERIFGTPPEALIKQYEIKDRRVRKQEAERRRLLEKAKMKGRKGKKGSKANPKAAPTAPNQPSPAQGTATVSITASQSQSQGTQSEEFYEDEYDDDEAQEDPPPPSPIIPFTPQRKISAQPDLSDSMGLRVGTGMRTGNGGRLVV